VYVHVTDFDSFESFKTGVAVIKTARDLYEREFAFLKDIYEFNRVYPAFDLLTGSDTIRLLIEEEKSLSDICSYWQEQEKAFIESERGYLLY
jgi:uncharacterized protein YbbC (DUF1343 family)